MRGSGFRFSVLGFLVMVLGCGFEVSGFRTMFRFKVLVSASRFQHQISGFRF